MRARCATVILLMALMVVLPGCGRASASADLDQLLEQGWRAYSTGDFDFAVASFEDVAEADAGLQQQFSALLGLATVYHLSTDPDHERARSYYQQLAEMPLGEAHQQALLGLGLLDLAAERRDEGRLKLTNLIREFPDSAPAHEAVLHLAHSLLEPLRDDELVGGYALPSSAQVQRAIRLMEDHLSEWPGGRYAAVLHMTLAGQYVRQEQYRNAVQHLREALDVGIESYRTRETVYWQIARIAEEKLNDYALAEQYYEGYLENFRRSQLYYRAQLSLERVRELRQGEG